MYRSIRITQIIEETAQAKTFVFEPADAMPMSYSAGQFITIVFPHHSGEERRSYSLSSAPGIDPHMAFTVKRVPNGAYSRKLTDHANVSDILQVAAVTGFFTLPEDEMPKRYMFMAAGSGITPIYSLVKSLLHSNDNIQVLLLYSNRSQADTIFYESLLQLEQQYKGRLLIEWLFSNNKQLAKARLNAELLSQMLKQYLLPPFDDVWCYLCGPYDYMQMAMITLRTAGIPDAHIRREQFDIVKTDVRVRPQDTSVHQVNIHMQNRVYSFPVQYPVSILEEAKRRNIQLPYSCEAGSCGACSANCISGSVWMSYNSVLTDSELAKGRILTCVGFPVGGDVILKYEL